MGMVEHTWLTFVPLHKVNYVFTCLYPHNRCLVGLQMMDMSSEGLHLAVDGMSNNCTLSNKLSMATILFCSEF